MSARAEILDAVRDAASGNVYDGYFDGNLTDVEHRLDAVAFVHDLYAAGWEIRRREYE